MKITREAKSGIKNTKEFSNQVFFFVRNRPKGFPKESQETETSLPLKKQITS